MAQPGSTPVARNVELPFWQAPSTQASNSLGAVRGWYSG